MILNTLAEFVSRPQLNVPDGAMKVAVESFIDTIGVMLQGSVQPVGELVTNYARSFGGGGSPLAGGNHANPALAALANAASAHAEDFDDATLVTLSGHISAVLVPVALAVGHDIGASGKDLLDAYAAGYEVEMALARGVNPYHYELGHHPTSTLGTFSAAATAARLYGLSAVQTAHALGIAASFASGIKANFGTMTKPLHCGWAAHSGIVAASLAKLGQRSNPLAYEAKQGFGPIFGGPDWGSDVVIEGIGENWSLKEPGVTLRKQWPCCGSLLTTIEAGRELAASSDFGPLDILKVRCGVHARRLPHTNRPNATTAEEGRFSLQYAAAASLLGHAMKPSDFTDLAVSDPMVQAIMARTDVYGDRRQTARTESMNGDDFGAVLGVTLSDGRELTMTIDYPKGSTRRPLSAEELATKFLECASARISSERAVKLLGQISELAGVENVRSLDYNDPGGTSHV